MRVERRAASFSIARSLFARRPRRVRSFSCLWQYERTPEQKAEFSMQLKGMNMLFLGTSVLILADRSYTSRFWVS